MLQSDVFVAISIVLVHADAWLKINSPICARVQIGDLGSGSFGECKLARDHDGEVVAVKFIERRKVST